MFKPLLVAFTCALAAVAQTISVGTPTSGQYIQAGKPFVVRVNRPDSLTGSAEIGIAISVQHCSQNPCEDVSERLGDTLFAGSFNPQFHTNDTGPPSQNYTVTVPSGFQTGLAALSVTHVALIGAGPFPFLEVRNVTVNVVN